MLPGMSSVMLLGEAPLGVPTLSACPASQFDLQFASATSYSQIALSNTGVLYGETAENGQMGLGYWLSPQNGMEQFSARWTNTTGTINVGTAGSWQSLAGGLTFGVTATAAGADVTKDATGTLEIARTTNTAVVLASKSGIHLRAKSDTEPAP